MSAYLLLSPDDVEDVVVPHAELVKAQRPTARELVEAIAIVGFFPDDSYLRAEAGIPPLAW